MKKLIISIVTIFSFIIVGFFGFENSNTPNTYLIMGDYLSVDNTQNNVDSFTSLLANELIKQKEVKYYNDSFTSNILTSDKMLEMIEKDIYKLGDSYEGSLKETIKKSKYITISVGMNDILPLLRFDSLKQKIGYDKELVDRKLEILRQNYFDIIEGIKEINEKTKVYITGYYFPFPWVEDDFKEECKQVFDKLNKTIKDVGRDTNTKYIDISSASIVSNLISYNEIYLNQNGQDYIFQEVSRMVINR